MLAQVFQKVILWQKRSTKYVRPAEIMQTEVVVEVVTVNRMVPIERVKFDAQ